MRSALLALALLSAVSAAAQEPEPDTTDWHLYLPLEVGNAWQYHFDSLPGWYTAFEVVGDSLVDGTPYFAVEHCTRYTDGTEVECGPTELVRYEGDAAAVVERRVVGGAPRLESWPSGLSNYTAYCRLDLPFGTPEAECFDGSGGTLGVSGEYGASVDVGGDPSPSGTYKSISGGFGTTDFLSGIGLVATSYELSDYSEIVFARIGGVEYGTPAIVVASEPAPPEAPALTVSPNPLRDAATLRFALAAPERLTLEVYDVRGRRVRALDLGAHGAEEGAVRFETAGLPPGAYRLRLLGDGGFEAVRGVIVLR